MYGLEEGVHPIDGILCHVFQGLVALALLLDAAALVHGLHGGKHAVLRKADDAVVLGKHGLFQQVGELFDDEGAFAGSRIRSRSSKMLNARDW
mgnify:CR=1 FL=1